MIGRNRLCGGCVLFRVCCDYCASYVLLVVGAVAGCWVMWFVLVVLVGVVSELARPVVVWVVAMVDGLTDLAKT